MTDLVTVTVPALPAAAQITGNELVPVHQNGRLVRVRQTELTRGGAAFVERVAAVAMTRGTVVVGAGLQMIQADPYDPSHCGRVLGILTQDVAVGVSGLAQSIGPMTGILGAFAGGDRLFIGAGGSLANAVPSGAKWRQPMGRADAANAITVALGEASIIRDDVGAVGGLASFRLRTFLGDVPSDSSARAVIEAIIPLASVTIGDQTTTIPDAIEGCAAIHHTSVSDLDYHCLSTDVQVGLVSLTAPRTVFLPARYPLGQVLFIADESGACSETLPITIQAGTGDSIAGQASVQITNPYQGLGFRRGAANLWIRAV
ncbi:hypothetical protein [Methylobacterium organophilum]|uniref:Uncharacterized protein n=1 Tax=Methylobacterium organophilum TaxID=410 RepID=A0ABQ4TD12_METOR|nr:hypothetical protein [Methylobacterium organophilum]GJE27937.1 hypothetical protein LKMONMHP_2799 [Methylobacterium organophilum]